MNKTETIDTYVKIMIDLLIMFSNSDLHNLENAVAIIYNGINIITHIFQMHLAKSPANVLYSCQKASFCYLEYIDQLQKSDVVNTLPLSDIAIFLFKQSESETSVAPSTHEVTIPPPNHLVKYMNHMMHILMDWNHPMELPFRIVICSTYLAEYGKTFESYPDQIEYLNCIIQKVAMTDEAYYHFLAAYYKRFLKTQKKGGSKYDLMDLYAYLGTHTSDVLIDVGDVKTFVHQII
jgi:hypothetical protein